MKHRLLIRTLGVLGLAAAGGWALAQVDASQRTGGIGRELSMARHLQDDEEFRLPLAELIEHGRKLFTANWTREEGGGRPQTKGNGRQLADPGSPLVGPRSMNRVSGPDSNSCSGCHNQPFGVAGGSGDFVANVFVQGQRFDFATFDRGDTVPTRGTLDESGKPVTLGTIAASRHTPGMFGGGYIEMLAREITVELQRIRDGMKRGETRVLLVKGIDFGKLTRKADGLWDVSQVTGLPRLSLITATPLDPPTLVVRPWHQAGNSVSLRDFTNTSYNHHHGIQTMERFGANTDPDGDGFVNEMTRADVTAVSVYQATMAVPGQVVPNDVKVEQAILHGQQKFSEFRCASCHVPALPLTKQGWTYTEPNPFNPIGNARTGDIKTLRLDLTDASLPQPRLMPDSRDADVLQIPAYTDFKLHDITDPKDPAPAESVDMNWPVWAPKFLEGNRRFLTRRLWGIANSGPYFHHGMFSTMREAILAHHGEAEASRAAFVGGSDYDRDALVEFLKSLQVLPPGTKALVVDEHFQPKRWSAAATAKVEQKVEQNMGKTPAGAVKPRNLASYVR